MMEAFYIGNNLIKQGGKPFIIAELSGNHNNSITKALKIIDLAVECGANAVKLQTYTADSITIESNLPDFVVNDPKNLWNGRQLYELYQEASTPYEWHETLFNHCKAKGILCFSTPFDEAAVDFLETFDPPCYKIASFENNHYPLIKKAVETGKPLIISVGLSTLQDIEELNQFLISLGAKHYVFLKCTSAYPANPTEANIETIPYLRDKLGINIGLSDHTMGIGVAIASIALGAQVIEKHFTDDRSAGGVDSAFSMEPSELKLLVQEGEKAWQSLGKESFALSPSETNSLHFKRSVYVVKDMKAGEKFTLENIRVIRPGRGLTPKKYAETLGRVSTRSLTRGEPLASDMIS